MEQVANRRGLGPAARLWFVAATLGGPAFLAGCGGAPPGRAVGERRSAPAVEVDPCARGGTWRQLAPVALAGRVDHTAIWTGRELVLWGGTQDALHPMDDGARYQPAGDTWRMTSPRLAPDARDDHAAVWTGREMIVWGGNSYDEGASKLASGGRYDPVEDVWRALPPSRLTARDDPRAVWTGTEMIVWGGRDARAHAGDGARYDPARDRWRPVTDVGAPTPREDHVAVWTGREMIVWGGWHGDDRARTYPADGGRYDPVADRWRPMSSVGAPQPREDLAAIWTGTELIVWGGVVRDGSPPERRQLATGGRYAPDTDTWSPLSPVEAPEAREDDVVVWTGRELLVWGGQRDGAPLGTGARYLPDRDAWCALPDAGAPVARRDLAGVWTGDELVLWGGRDAAGAFLASGAAYAPE